MACKDSIDSYGLQDSAMGENALKSGIVFPCGRHHCIYRHFFAATAVLFRLLSNALPATNLFATYINPRYSL